MSYFKISPPPQAKETRKCDRCLLKYELIYRSCPNCFRRRCQRCYWIWRSTYETNCFCPRCSYPYSEGVMTSTYDERTKKYVPCQPVVNPFG